MLRPASLRSPILLRSTCLHNPHGPRAPVSARTLRLSAARFFPRIPRPEPSSDAPRSSKGQTTFIEELAKEDLLAKQRSASNFGRNNGPAPRTDSFRAEMMKEDPTFEQPKFKDTIGTPKVWRHVAFAAVVSYVFYLQCARDTNFDTARLSASFPAPLLATNEHLRRMYSNMLAERLKKHLQDMKDTMANWPAQISVPIAWSYVKIANEYLGASEGKRVAYQITAVNGFVWFLWQLKSLRPFMNAHFTHNPLSGRYITLLTSIFSHQSFIHLLANSLALVSFGHAASVYLMQEQAKSGSLESSPKYHFWGAYVAAGLCSSLTSHVVATRITYPRLLAQIRQTSSETPAVSTAFRRTSKITKDKATMANEIRPSLGASGAIYAMVTMSALAFPDAQVMLMFLPIHMPITVGVGGMVALDVLGIIRGWRLFDHWAHLSGAAFGVLYHRYGPRIWDETKARVKLGQERP